jgi:hypothetical protein
MILRLNNISLTATELGLKQIWNVFCEVVTEIVISTQMDAMLQKINPDSCCLVSRSY